MADEGYTANDDVDLEDIASGCEPCYVSPLHPFHESFRQEYFGDTSPEEFLQTICLDGHILPEPSSGQVFHVPITWMGAYDFGRQTDDGFYEPPSGYVGWRRLKYLFILPSPSYLDLEYRQAFDPRRNQVARFFREELERAGIDPKDVLVTYANRFILPKGKKSYSAKHLNICTPYLKKDIQEVKPRVIVTFGASPIKALYGGKAKLDTYRGNAVQYRYDGGSSVLIPSVSPVMFTAGHGDLSVFRLELERAKKFADDPNYSCDYKPVDYRVCDTLDKVTQLISDIKAENPRHIAFDTEFGNDVAREEFNYVLSLQVSWAKGKAAVIPLRRQEPVPSAWRITFGKPKKEGEPGRAKCKELPPRLNYGVPIYSPDDERRVWELFRDLFTLPTVRLDGHHLRVDINWFHKQGLSIDDRVETGFCTMLVHHLLHGDDSQGLDHLVRKYLPSMGAYWMELNEWLSENGSSSNLKFGYRNIPDDIRNKYALYDADATWQITEILEQELEAQPALKNLYWNQVAPAALHLMDVERQGILVDDEKRMELRAFYQPIYEKLLEKFRKEINWPDFSPRSKENVAALLFSKVHYKDKKPAPEGVKVLSLKPLFNTDKYPKMWEDIERDGSEGQNTPSTKSTAIDLLRAKYPDIPELKWLKYLSVLGKFLTTYLAPCELNEFGVLKDGKGFHCNIWSDGRVRTHFSQLSETGRIKSFKTNLQTQPKKQEAAAQEAVVELLLGLPYLEYLDRINDKWQKDPKAKKHPNWIPPEERIHFQSFKTCLVARPGYSMIESDFKSAEMFGWAYGSGDPELIRLLESGRDMHSEVACNAFGLPPLAELGTVISALNNGDPEPYAKWNKAFKNTYEALRTAAKTINFGG